MEIYKERLETSSTEKRGLTFFLQGRTISGVVVEILEDHKAVVLQSQITLGFFAFTIQLVSCL